MKEANGEAIQTLASYTVSEAQIENLVTAKGYTDCVAFIGDESVSVVVSAREGASPMRTWQKSLKLSPTRPGWRPAR